MDFHKTSLLSTIVTKGLCAGLGEEKGLVPLGDFEEDPGRAPNGNPVILKGEGNANAGRFLLADNDKSVPASFLSAVEENPIPLPADAAIWNGLDFA